MASPHEQWIMRWVEKGSIIASSRRRGISVGHFSCSLKDVLSGGLDADCVDFSEVVVGYEDIDQHTTAGPPSRGRFVV